MFPVKLTGKRLLLREYEIADAPIRFSYFNDPNVFRYQAWHPTPTLESAVQRVTDNYAHARSEERTEYVLAITVDNQVIGETGLLLGDPKDNAASVFYTLAHAAWGKGYASEAAKLVVKFGFESLRLHRISLTTHPANYASIAIATQKLGMQFEGTHRDYEFGAAGHFLDMNVYASLASDPRPYD